MGILVSVSSIFLAVGPLLGGSLTQYFSWRYVFWINLPIAILGVLLALPTVPKTKGHKESFDFAGFITLAIAIGSITIALMQSQTGGWSSSATLSLVAIGILLPYLLFKVERKTPHPIFDLAIVLKRSFLSGVSCIFCNQLLIMVSVFWAIYFQVILGFSPTKAGLFSFIANAPILLAPPIAGYLVDRVGPRVPVRIGFFLIAISLFLFVFISPPTNTSALFAVLIPFGFGIPLIFTPSYVSVMNDVSDQKRGVASGTTAAFRQFGATLGLALFGTAFTNGQMLRLQHLFSVNPETTNLKPHVFEGLLSHSPTALKALNRLSTLEAAYVTQSVKSAFLFAFGLINTIAGCIAIVGLIIAHRFLKNHPIHLEK